MITSLSYNQRRLNGSNYRKNESEKSMSLETICIVIGIKLKVKLSTIKKYELVEYVEEEQTF